MVFDRERNGRRRSRSRSRSRGRSPVGRRFGASSRTRAHPRADSRSPKRSRFRRSRSRSASRSPTSIRRPPGRPGFGSYESPPENECVGVFNLNPSTTERHVQSVFSRYGRIRDVTLICDRMTGRSRGFGFVAFEHIVDAREARERCNGIELDGRRIRVDFSSTQRPHTPTPGMYMGKPSNGSFSNASRDEDRGRRNSSRYR